MRTKQETFNLTISNKYLLLKYLQLTFSVVILFLVDFLILFISEYFNRKYKTRVASLFYILGAKCSPLRSALPSVRSYEPN